jgi:crossover junction endodeoxyribonuclease RuvC
MVRLLLGLSEVPEPHDASDALAIAICHVHSSTGPVRAAAAAAPKSKGVPKTWREYRP